MLFPDSPTREKLWHRLQTAVEDYFERIRNGRVTPESDLDAIRQSLAAFDFNASRSETEVLEFAIDRLWRYQVHTPHPRYFGLFNPAPTFMGIMGDALVAAFNPQLAAWSHSPFAVEVEQHVVQRLGERFGWEANLVDGTFASGGAEANHTAVLSALFARFPETNSGGVRALTASPVVYISAEGHHSIAKAARLCGLGADSVRQIRVDSKTLAIDCNALLSAIQEDRAKGLTPFLVVATAGTTSSGAIDPLPAMASIAKDNDMWFHVDAAWGGAAAICPELRHLLEGIQFADSITFDAHKWLSVPMGAGIFLTRHRHILNHTFSTANPYMPSKATSMEVVDPYSHSIQWSRRFTGLKVFLSLASSGWDGYAQAIRHQVEMGEKLREKLPPSAWRILNQTKLPLVCFADPRVDCTKFVSEVWSRGNVWISSVMLANGRPALRACITNFKTTEEDVDALVEELNAVRKLLAPAPA